MSDLNFINNSNDSNNSQIVIFEAEAASSSKFEAAWRSLSLTPGAKSKVPVAENGEFYVSVVSPEATFNGELMTINEQSSPAVKISAGQTAIITGDANSGYNISVS